MENPETPSTPTFEQLVTEKMKAGLDRLQAESLVKAQLAHNKKLSSTGTKAAKEDAKKTAQA